MTKVLWVLWLLASHIFVVGRHMANGPISGQDVARYHRRAFSGAELMWYADPQVISRLGSNPASVVVRLPDSVSGGVVAQPSDYAAACAQVIRRFYAAGVRYFQLDNEPNWSWGQDGLYRWHDFMTQVLPRLRRAVADLAGLQLGFTPMSWPRQQDWLTVNRDLARACDWVAVHAYWQAAPDMYAPYFGGQVTVIHQRFPEKPLLVTEARNSIQEVTDPPPPAQVDRLRAGQYPEYRLWLQSLGYVRGVYFYILGGTTDWAGYQLHPAVLDALGELALDPEPAYVIRCINHLCKY